MQQEQTVLRFAGQAVGSEPSWQVRLPLAREYVTIVMPMRSLNDPVIVR
jgi:hypothetical protein